MSDPAEERDWSDKRSDARHRALLGGKLVAVSGDYSIDCTIRDVSDSGARLRMLAPVPVADRVYLVELRTGTAYRIRVVWRRDNELGVSFEERVTLDDDVRDPELKRLRRLWLDAGVR